MSKKEKQVKTKKPVTAKTLMIYQAVTVGLILIVDVIYSLVLFYANRVSILSKWIFVLVNCGVLVALLLMNVLAILLYSRKTKLFVKQIVIGVLAIFLLIGGYGLFTVSSLFGNVNKVIQTGETENEEREVVFVTYMNSTISTLKDASNKKIGIIDNINFIEGNILALEELNNQGVKGTLVNFENYTDLLMALFAGNIDIAALPGNYVQQFETNEGFEEFLKDTNIVHSYKKVVTLDNENKTDIDVKTDPFTILVMGNDGENHTDAMILITVNPTNMIMTMTSIARDSYVPIACYNGQAKDKLTHARAISRQCTIDTIENLLDVDINFYVEINFKGVVQIVDAIGAIPVYSPVSFTGQNSDAKRGTYNVWIEEGLHPRTGEQVLAIARERKAPGFDDFVRQKNQQAIIEAIIKEVLNLRSINKAVSIFEAAGDNISTNMSMNQMLDLLTLGIETMDNSQFKNAKIITTYGSRLYGYSSETYNYPSELVLWIYPLFQGSIKDNAAFIKNNLRIDVVPEIPHTFRYNATWGGYEYVNVPSYYNEQQVHETLPPMVPNLVGRSLADAQAWAKANGITLNVVRVEAGNGSYNPSYPQNSIITQSERYGRLLSKISSITVSVIKHPVNCELAEFLDEPECSAVPNLVGKKLSDSVYKNFIAKYNIKPTIKYLMPGDAGYDSSKAGTIASTNPVAGTTATSGMAFTVTIYVDPNDTVSVGSFVGQSKDAFELFCTTNGLVPVVDGTDIQPSLDTGLIGKTNVKTNEQGTKVKNGGTVKVTYVTYVKGVTVPLLVGTTSPPAAVPGLTFVESGTTPATGGETPGTIASQSIATGTLVAEGTIITYTIYEAVPIPPSP